MKIFITKTILLSFIFIAPIVSFAHSGKTDSNGGHYDSSTGEYHYHHGYSAHQHNADGSCPYETSSDNNDDEILTIKGTNDDEYYKNKTNELQSRVDELESQITSKDFRIAELEEEIEKSKEENKSQEDLHYIYILIIVIICCISYLKLKSKENKK